MSAGTVPQHRVLHKWRPSLAMIVFAVLATVLALPLVSLFFFRLYENQLIRQAEGELIAQSVALAALVAREFGSEADTPAIAEPIQSNLDLATSPILEARPDGRTPPQPPGAAARAAGHRIEPSLVHLQKLTLASLRVLDAAGTVIAGTNEVGLSFAHVEEVAAALKGRFTGVLRLQGSDAPIPALYSISRGSRVRVFVAMPVLAGGSVVGVVYGSRTPVNILRHLYSEQGKVIGAGATVVVVTLVIGFLFWRTITRPMRDLVRYTELVGSGSRDAPRLPDHHGTRELATLSRSFVDMATRLRERTDYITTFAAHVSHELKSPLSAIRGAAELLRDSGAEMSPDEQRRFLDNILADAARLTALVARLRELARADNPRIGETRLDAIVAAVRIGHPALSFSASGTLDQPVRISAENADIVLSHLADNAFRHHARSIEIVARVQGESIVITVRNDGDPIADNNREKVFTPFFTTRRESGGTGMGLEIVRSMLHAHGGGIRLVAADPVTFEIDIPRA